MMISTRGRYAIRVMIDLAEQGSAGYTRLKDISERQDISLKYLESITTELSKSGLIDGVHGKGGGYRLNRPPQEYTLTEILHACDAKPCDRTQICRTLPMWKKLYETVNNFFDGYTVADLLKTNVDFEYMSAGL